MPTTDVRLCIAMPIRDRPTAPTLRALEHSTPRHTLLTVTGKPVDEARNELARMALALEPRPDIILWIDADAFWTQGTVEKLVGALIQYPRMDLVTGFFGVREPHRPPTVYRRIGDPDSFVRLGVDCPMGDCVQVGCAGFHMAAHRPGLLERIGPAPFSAVVAGDGEDAAFCRRVGQVGGIQACHTGALVAHVGDDGCAYLPGGPPFAIHGDALVPLSTALPKARGKRDRDYGAKLNARFDAVRPVRVLESW